jgi:hypothetical protein
MDNNFSHMFYDIHIQGGLWTVTYTETSGTLQLSFEMGMPHDIVFVPTEEGWKRTMPDWAQGRRDQIIERVCKAFTKGCEVIEMD